MLLTYDLPYHHDSARLFERIAHLPWAIFLDSAQHQNASGQPSSQYGHYDILVANPFIKIMVGQTLSTVVTSDSQYTSTEDPFALISQLLAPYQAKVNPWPFAGGALGYFGYDLARRLEKLPEISRDDTQMPLAMVGVYDWAVVVDHRAKTATLVSHGFAEETRGSWKALCDCLSTPVSMGVKSFLVDSEIQANMTERAYCEAFDKIKAYIRAGDCYQVNLAQRFSAKAQGNSWLAYKKLREISPAPFMAYMQYDDLHVLSASPERFLQVVNRHVETRPIKGTRPRAEDSQQDMENAQALQHSVKDRAENLMIVDLLRNDIGKNCTVGSVRADKLFQLQSFSNVHHLVSIVTGKLAAGKTALDLLRGCFPGGSITGAPKLRAMEIIEELEPNRRGLYCGAIGYVGFDGNMDTNIPIRTAVYSHGEIRFYAGGGIVADSTADKEYRETLDKASSMMRLLRYFQNKDAS